MTFFLVLGGTIGLVSLGSFLTSQTHGLEAAGASVSESYLVAMPRLFAISAALIVPAVVAILALPMVQLPAAKRAAAAPAAPEAN